MHLLVLGHRVSPLLLWAHTLSLGLLEEAPVDVTVVMVRVLDSGNAVEEYSPDCMTSCFDVGHMFHNGIPVVLRPLLHPCTCKLPLPTQTGGRVFDVLRVSFPFMLDSMTIFSSPLYNLCNFISTVAGAAGGVVGVPILAMLARVATMLLVLVGDTCPPS